MKRQIATAAVFLMIIFGLLIANLVYIPPQFSIAERRRLTTLPDITKTNRDGSQSLNPNFAGEFETYALDSFVWRDGFRSIKARLLRNVFLQKDSNGIYIQNGSAAKIIVLNADSVAKTAQKLAKVMQLLPQSTNVYYSVIPDKGRYMGGGFPQPDYAQIEEIMAQNMAGAEYISLMDTLTAEAYYATDLHWRQERLEPVVKALLSGMGVEYSAPDYETNTLKPFYGVYYGQAALPLKADTMEYLTGDWLASVTARYLDSGSLKMLDGDIYHVSRFQGMDPYDVFLGGAQPLIALDNPDALTDRQLYIFRDSFSSSLAPLLCRYYSGITLIDLRYFSSAAVEMLVEFTEDADVLFLLGMQVVNDSALSMVQ